MLKGDSGLLRFKGTGKCDVDRPGLMALLLPELSNSNTKSQARHLEFIWRNIPTVEECAKGFILFY